MKVVRSVSSSSPWTAAVLLFTSCCSLLPSLLLAYPFEYDFSAVWDDQSPRELQTSGGNLPDLGKPTKECNAVGGSQFLCALYQKVGFETEFMELNITVQCYLDATTGFDFRRSTGCTCQTLLTPSDTTRLPKVCPCSICPIDFGSSSFSIDCSHLIPNATNTTESDAPSMVPSPSQGGGGGGGIPLPPTTVPDATQITRLLQQTSAPSPGRVGTLTGAPTPGIATTKTDAPSPATVAQVTDAPTPKQAGQTTKAPAPGGGGGTTTAAPTRPGAVTTTNAPSSGTTTTSPPSVGPTTSAVPSMGPLPDPYIFQTCVSVDCFGNCNGTCSLGCDNPTAATKCNFCAGAEGQPTPSPTGEGEPTSAAATLATVGTAHGLGGLVLQAALVLSALALLNAS